MNQDLESSSGEQERLLAVVQGLQKQVSGLQTQVKLSEQRQSRRNLRAASRRAVRHSIMNRNTAMSTNNLMVPLEEEEQDYDDDSSVEEEEVRTFPNNTFSFLLLARYPLVEKAKAQPSVVEADPIVDDQNDESGMTTSERTRQSRSKDWLCLPFWLGVAILVLQVLIYSLVLQYVKDAMYFSIPWNHN